MFQFPGLALSRSGGVSPARFPHSDIPGSMLACSSPRLIAACHVLHRRLVPRHPPCALLHLTSTNRWSRIKKHAQNDARFTQSPGLPRVHLLPYEVPKTFSHRPMLSRSSGADRRRAAFAVLQSGFRGSRRVDSRELFGRPCGQLTRRLQKGGDPAAGSPTATLLRLRPSYQTCLRPLPPEGWVTDFGHSRLPWRDGRCVQGPGTYSPWRC